MHTNIRAHGGKWRYGNITEWGRGSSGGRVPLTALCSCSLASFGCSAQLDQEVASYDHNSGVKAQRIKCCVTPRQRNSVIMRACAQLRVCVCMHCVCSVSVCQFEVAV